MSVVETTASVLFVALDTVVVVGIASVVAVVDTVVAAGTVVGSAAVVVGIVVVGTASKRLQSLPS